MPVRSKAKGEGHSARSDLGMQIQLWGLEAWGAASAASVTARKWSMPLEAVLEAWSLSVACSVQVRQCSGDHNPDPYPPLSGMVLRILQMSTYEEAATRCCSKANMMVAYSPAAFHSLTSLPDSWLAWQVLGVCQVSGSRQ